MGKKTIKVPFTNTVPKPSMFCQNKDRLLELYKSEKELGGMVGCVIRPLPHVNGGYFFYRKVLDNGEMLINGECFPAYNKTDYQEGVYYMDEDYEPNTIFFIEEDSLTDDDVIDENDELNNKINDEKLQQELQKLKISAEGITDPIDEYRVYVVDVQITETLGMSSSDEEFIAESEKQGNVFSLKKFEDALNFDDINTENCLFRIIKQNKNISKSHLK